MALVPAKDFDNEGEWEIRVSVYRNGKRVGFTDCQGDSFEFCAEGVSTDLNRKVLSK